MTRFLNFINEKYLTSDFKFGFEFECINSKDREFEELKNCFDPSWEIYHLFDLSIRSIKHETFELTVGILHATPENILKVIKSLETARKLGFSTNKSCGFHVHTSWPDLDELHAAWVILNLAYNDNFKQFLYFKDKFNFFSNKYAFYRELLAIQKAMKNETADMAHYNATYKSMEIAKSPIFKKYLNIINAIKNTRDTKYTLFHLHNLGTIEWRGPRDFMNTGSKEIHDFFMFYLKVVNFFRNSLDNKQVGWIQFNEFESMFKQIGKGSDISTYLQYQNKSSKNDPRWKSGTSSESINKVFKLYPFLGKCKFKNVQVILDNNKLTFADGKILSGNYTNIKFFDCEITGGTFSKCIFKGWGSVADAIINNCTCSRYTFYRTKINKTELYSCNIETDNNVSNTKIDQSTWVLNANNVYENNNTWDSSETIIMPTKGKHKKIYKSNPIEVQLRIKKHNE